MSCDPARARAQLTCAQLFELLAGGDYLFDPQAGSRYSKDEDHIAQIIELMGEFPPSLAFSGKYSSRFFNRKGGSGSACLLCAPIADGPANAPGELRHINKLRFWPLQDVFRDKYEFSIETADTIGSFLNPMLRLNPEKRAGAGELIHHRWLDAVVVQGEVDVIRRAEEEEARRRALSAPSAANGAAPANLIEHDSDADALKPVDDELPPAEDELPPPKNAPQLSHPHPRPSSANAKENAPRPPKALAEPAKTPGASSQDRKRS